MWEHDWSGHSPPTALPGQVRSGQVADRLSVRRVAPLYWEEHCVECAPPTCFTTCSLFVRRADGICARFEQGIQRHPGAGGGTDASTAAEIRFRRWAKLVTDVPAGLTAPRWVWAARKVDRVLGSGVRLAARVVPSPKLADRILSAYGWRRRRFFRQRGRSAWEDATFIVDVWNLGARPVDLLFEHSRDGITLFRHSWTLGIGRSRFELPLQGLAIRPGLPGSRFTVAPAGDDGAHLVFESLDVVVLHERPTPSGNRAAGVVKCVAWDLDNTLWAGVLAEASPEDLVIDTRAVEVMRRLDERGILQTVVSKNDQALALDVLERFGLLDLILAPAISWRPKSDGLRDVAEALNLGLDSFMFIDDSAFERAEVAAALPMVRVVDVVELDGLLDRPELAAPASSEARTRRVRYQEEGRRRVAQSDSGYDYEAFIRSCELRAEVFVPRDEEERTRCVELIQRSNQLNLSGRRHTREAFDALEASGQEWFAMRASDRFGPYGIMGVMGVERVGDETIIRDLCISCRAANRMLEQAWMDWLVRRSAGESTHVVADLVPTERNGALRGTLESAGFRPEPGDGSDRLVLAMSSKVPGADLVVLIDQTAGAAAG